MYEVNPSEWKTKPFAHQVVGVKFLLNQTQGALGDKPGSGKSKQFIDTACILWNAKEIDTLVICAPASVKSTWGSREFGQITNHCWIDWYDEEYSARNPKLHRPDPSYLHIIITNYEFIRNDDRLRFLLPQLRNRKTMLVFDESSYIKSHRASQTKASQKLRQACGGRAYLANGSLISESLIDLYAPFAVLDKKIIGSENWWAFRNRYCQMGGYQNKQIMGYTNVEFLQKRLKPYILYRLKEDCFDLPPKMYNVAEVAMSPETWRVYKELRDEMIAWLDQSTPLITMSAIVKIVRLSQLTSGMVGGLARSRELMTSLGMIPESLFDSENSEDSLDQIVAAEDIRVISTEKHAWVVSWLQRMIEGQPNFRVIFWTRFRKEQELLRDMISKALPQTEILRIYGGQKKLDREAVLSRFNAPAPHPVALLGQPRAGGIGLNLQSECNWAFYVSNDYSALTREQSEDRIHRAGQTALTVNYQDILMTGPQGQKTVDHAVRKALIGKDTFAMKTAAYWRAAIAEE